MALLQPLFHSGKIWRGKAVQPRTHGVMSSGIEAMDQLLLGGWPRGHVSELLHQGQGIGELRLLLPILARLSEQATANAQWLVFVAPPFIPYAPALQSAGIDISRILWLQPEQPKQGLWATEQCLKSGSCVGVLSWLESSIYPKFKLKGPDIRRLQLAADQGQSFSWLIRPERYRTEASPATCRLVLSATSAQQMLSVECLKRRGAWPLSAVRITLPGEPLHDYVDETEIAPQLVRGPWQQSGLCLE
ncbi:translesion DNA synthesis-associated protein ImuA [Echinimonas agarilytica]|uniref:Translesion DNA synthesis-associated protein ImuA n=1 Tax=Echinimonas agarilytica TaxID=1215918 RepID=A0AA41WA61_9GAMM|nr:translesion DNA synthesis-associated protein ImuA [Echinimonas agarilytica]MCM2681093.1 translesion DNA synthesis-associated protein ImuA [Echinimonas agarilytica]